MPLKSFAIVALCALLLTEARAQESIRRITLDGNDGAPAPETLVITPEVLRVRQVPVPAMEIFPSGTRPSHGTIMISPGGGYLTLAITKEGRNVAKMLNAAGWDAAVLLYPINAGPEERPLALDAAEKAWALLQKRGADFGLSTAKMGAMGFSAGGHLSARLAHETPAASAPAFLVLMYPAYLKKDGKLADDVAPTPAPTFLYVGDKDTIAGSSAEAYAAVCKEKGIRCDYTVAVDVGHGFGLTSKLPAGAQDWTDKLKAFLASLGGK